MKLQLAVYIALSLLGTALSRSVEKNYESELEAYDGMAAGPEAEAEQEEETEVQASVQQGEVLQED